MNIVDDPNFLERVFEGAKEDEERLRCADLEDMRAMIEDNWGEKLQEGEEASIAKGND